jgi:hypothetical protein
LLDPVSQPVVRQGRAYRPLRPIAPAEARLFALLLDGQFLLQGFRNQDVRERLLDDPGPDEKARRQAAGKITRLFRLLRAHRLIRKVSKTFYYRVTNRGVRVMATALQLRELNLYALAA